MCVIYTTPGVAVNMGGRDGPAYFLRTRTPVFSLCMPVSYLSCHLFAIANRRFSQPSSSPDPAAVPYAIVLPWVLHLPFLGWFLVRGSRGFGCFPRWMGLGGDEVDFWVFLVAFHRWMG
jgi:hypothetical protein